MESHAKLPESPATFETLFVNIDLLHIKLKNFYLNIMENKNTPLESKTILADDSLEKLLSEIISTLEYLISKKILANTHRERIRYYIKHMDDFLKQLKETIKIQIKITRNEVYPLGSAIMYLSILKDEITLLSRKHTEIPTQNHPELRGDFLQFDKQKYNNHQFGLTPFILDAYLRDEKNIFRHIEHSPYLFNLVIKNASAVFIELFIISAIKQQMDFVDYKIWLYPNEKGQTPLDIIAYRGKLNSYLILYKYIMMEKNYLDIVNQKDHEGMTALHSACMKHSFNITSKPILKKIEKIIKSLIYVGTDIHITDEIMCTPFAYSYIPIIMHFGKIGFLVGNTLPNDIDLLLNRNGVNKNRIKQYTCTEFSDGTPSSLYYKNIADEGDQYELTHLFKNPNLKKGYFTYLASRRSLTHLAAAHVFYNQTHNVPKASKVNMKDYEDLSDQFPFFLEKEVANEEKMPLKLDVNSLVKLINDLKTANMDLANKNYDSNLDLPTASWQPLFDRVKIILNQLDEMKKLENEKNTVHTYAKLIYVNDSVETASTAISIYLVYLDHVTRKVEDILTFTKLIIEKLNMIKISAETFKNPISYLFKHSDKKNKNSSDKDEDLDSQKNNKLNIYKN